MLHPAARLQWIDTEIGFGVFATAPMPRGTLIWVLDELDVILTSDQVRALPDMLRRQIDRYAYRDRYGRFVLCWDFGRYMNHACNPTSRPVGEAFEVAVRDIEAGQQLTCDYGSLNLTAPLRCRCGAPKCRQVIRPSDMQRYAAAWDRETRQAWARAPLLSQPLLPFVRAEGDDQHLLRGVQNGEAPPIPSIRRSSVLGQEIA